MESEEQQDKNEQQGHRNRNGQALLRRLEVFELSAVGDVITGWQLDFFVDPGGHIRNDALDIPVPDIETYRSYLQSIPGIGLVTSLTILARIGDPERLTDIREIGAFAGVVPKEKSTGDTINRGSITHAGNAALRSLLVEASWVAIRRDKELEQFYNRIRSRHHPRIASRKAIVAVARKLTQRIYKVLKEQRMYEIR